MLGRTDCGRGTTSPIIYRQTIDHAGSRPFFFKSAFCQACGKNGGKAQTVVPAILFFA